MTMQQASTDASADERAALAAAAAMVRSLGDRSDCGLITARPQGRVTVYSLARPELLELLSAAERLLAATGDAVSLCPTYGDGTNP